MLEKKRILSYAKHLSEKHLLLFPVLDSTNLYLMREAKKGLPEWTVVVAEQQTAGRGRMERLWFSPPEVGLWFSVLLKPALPSSQANLINLFTALSLLEFLEQELQALQIPAEVLQLKWPNDLLAKGRKLAGILLQGDFSGGQINFLVCGIGLNVNQQVEDFPQDLRAKAISLRMVSGRPWERERLLAKFLDFYFERYHQYVPHRMPEVLNAYERRLGPMPQPVRIQVNHHQVEGLMEGITTEGFLKVRRGNQVQIISSGELEFVPEKQE